MTTAEVLRPDYKNYSDPRLALAAHRMHWLRDARPKQLTPPGDWLVWFNRCGRGYGKTRLGAEWLIWEAGTRPNTRWAVISPTYDDVRFTCFEGESGILSILPPSCYDDRDYNRSFPMLRLWNNSTIWGFSGERPNRLRGPQFHGAWVDELAAFMKDAMEESWDNLQFGLRLMDKTGKPPQALVTTTPRPLPLIRKLCKAPHTILTNGSIYENKENLAPKFFDRVVQYEGTNFGRQEIYGELIDPEESGIIKRSWFKMWKLAQGMPRFEYIILSLDTALTEKTYDDKKGEPDFTAATVFGVFAMPDGTAPVGRTGLTKPKFRMNVMVLDAWRDQLGFPDLVDRVVKEMKLTYGTVERPKVKSALYGTVPPALSAKAKKVDILLIEDKGSGISLRQTLAKKNIITHPYNPGKADKMSRAHIVSHIPHAGLVWIPESRSTSKLTDAEIKDRGLNRQFADWSLPWIEEICVFPNSDFDDWMDTLTQGLRLLSDKGILTVLPPKVYDPDAQKDEDMVAQKKRRRNPYGG